MRLMAASDDLRFQCYLLEDNDPLDIANSCQGSFWEAQTKNALLMLGSKPQHDKTNERFILWDAHQETIIGYSRIYKPTHCVFTGDHIVEKMRGNQLIDYLYKARLRLLREQGYDGEIIVHTGKDNNGTAGAAIRSGFQSDANEIDNQTFKRQTGYLEHEPALEHARMMLA